MRACRATPDFASTCARSHQAGGSIPYPTSSFLEAGSHTFTIQIEGTRRSGGCHQGGSTTRKRQGKNKHRAQASLVWIAVMVILVHVLPLGLQLRRMLVWPVLRAREKSRSCLRVGRRRVVREREREVATTRHVLQVDLKTPQGRRHQAAAACRVKAMACLRVLWRWVAMM